MKSTLALTNGRIYSLDGGVHEAVAITGDRIEKLGSSLDIRSSCSSGTKVIDLKGHTVIPGFNDSHMHCIACGLEMNTLKLSQAGSIEDVIRIGRNHIEENRIGKGRWIIGTGWNQDKYPGKRSLTKNDLDRISREHPIYFLRCCNHVAVVNSMAIRVAGITRDTTVEGGVFEHDEAGEPTGFLKENAVDWIEKKMPQPDKATLRKAWMRTQQEALRFGITTIQTSDLNIFGSPDEMYDFYAGLRDEGGMSIRVIEQLYMPGLEALREYLSSPSGRYSCDEWFALGPMKFLTDGSLGARTAALESDYEDDRGNKGQLLFSQQELDAIVETVHDKGMTIFLHAIGDAALRACLDSLEKAQKGRPSGRRHRINHVQIGSHELFSRMKRLGLIADIQPIFVRSDWHMAMSRIGRTRIGGCYAWKTLMDLGIPLAAGSDCPSDEMDPIQGIHAAVTRQDTRGNPEGGFMPEQRLSVEQALGLYTKGSAYASNQEKVKGTLSPGKLADLAILSDDLFRVPDHAIKDIQTLATIVGGEIAYSDGSIF
jgi:predicted amidohydrolase YtcJ